MEKLNQLIAQRAALVDKLSADDLINDATKFAAAEAEIAELDKKIDRAKRAQQVAAAAAHPANAVELAAAVEPAPAQEIDLGSHRQVARQLPFDHYVRRARSELRSVDPDAYARVVGPQGFRTLGEQLRAVASYYLNGRDVGTLDKRLVRAPTGAAENDPSAGGFLVQTDFATGVFTRAYETGQVIGRANKLTLSTAANSIKIPGIDETSRATGSRYGGVQSYWTAEGGQPSTSKPKFRHIELDLKKLMSLFYVTDELIADASVLTQIASQAFSEEIMFMVEDSMFRGTGAGQPLGFLNAPCKVAVAKETGQATKTIVYENVLKMWARCWGRSRQNAVWFINQDVETQLYALSQVIGTAGVPVYLPANGISGSPYGTLFGRPVLPVEYGDTLGTEGDITLADFTQYVLADKGGVQAASSMHVAFLTDEMVFRITYRVDGEPIWNAALTPYKGSNTLSPFVTLAAR